MEEQYFKDVFKVLCECAGITTEDAFSKKKDHETAKRRAMIFVYMTEYMGVKHEDAAKYLGRSRQAMNLQSQSMKKVMLNPNMILSRVAERHIHHIYKSFISKLDAYMMTNRNFMHAYIQTMIGASKYKNPIEEIGKIIKGLNNRRV